MRVAGRASTTSYLTMNMFQNSARDQIGSWATWARCGLLVETTGLQRQHILKGECSSRAAATVLSEETIDGRSN